MDAAAFVDDHVRRALRRGTLDPDHEKHALREVAEDGYSRWASRWHVDGHEPAGASTPFPSVGSAPGTSPAVAAAVHEFAGFGPLQAYLDDPTVEEIWWNRPDRIFIARSGRSEIAPLSLEAGQAETLVERMLRFSGRRLDTAHPYVDASLPDGSRLHVVIPDITRTSPAVNIRKFTVRPRHIHDLCELHMLTETAANFLDACVVAGLNIVVAGATQAGKTTTLNALLGCIPGRERVITCEETFELNVSHHPDVVALQTRPPSLEGTAEVTLRDLVRESLRMRPQRLVVGEVRSAEALDLLLAMNCGLPAMASIHANSAREAVTKLATLPLLSGQNIPAHFITPTVAACVDIVVHLSTSRNGHRQVTEISHVPGACEGAAIAMEPVFAIQPASGQGGRQGVLRHTGLHPRPEQFTAADRDLDSILGAESTRRSS